MRQKQVYFELKSSDQDKAEEFKLKYPLQILLTFPVNEENKDIKVSQGGKFLTHSGIGDNSIVIAEQSFKDLMNNTFKVQILKISKNCVFNIGVASKSEEIDFTRILGIKSNTFGFNNYGDFYFGG